MNKFKPENIYCVGRNYIEHTKEMNYDLPSEPVIFLKPNSAIINNGIVAIPEFKGKKISNNLHHEVELVIVIGKEGDNIEISKSKEYISGFAVGIDFTLRDLQSEFKKKGMPWAVSKGFRNSAGVSEILPKDRFDFDTDSISLRVNGELRQDSKVSEMIFKPDFLIHYLSSIFGLKKGDIIFTGTPSGVSQVVPGDKIEAEISGKAIIKVEVQ